METRANYLIVGLFTLAVIASGFVFVWWFSQPAQRAQGSAIEVAYDGAVSGLRAGSSVLFNGIWVGEVRSLRLDP
ncbi:MAG: MCE family protein, partial [Methylacidiphilales bacterium]|nr:MCE family protein [Candidatus Methylacidiphilales bacterium]